jgi:NADPH:quinone reductase
VPTAYALLHLVGRLRRGDRVLVNAAAGATGMVLGQMLRAADAEAVGIVSSRAKVATALGYGFARVLTTAELEAEALADQTFELVLDSAGADFRVAAGAR